MYNVAFGANNIINKTRRDLTQKLDKLDKFRELTRKDSGSSGNSPVMNSPQLPTFHNANRNRAANGRLSHPTPEVSAQHQELVKFFNESWEQIRRDYESRQNGTDSKGSPQVHYYKGQQVHPSIENFKPFNLEEFWGTRVYHKVTQQSR